MELRRERFLLALVARLNDFCDLLDDLAFMSMEEDGPQISR